MENTVREKHHEHFKLQSWKDIDSLGQITTNLCRAIGEADYALFYLSEPTPDEDQTSLPYQDNPNVLFECGIKHGRYVDSETGATRWLALREMPELTGAVPFDFSGHKMIYVARNKKHAADTKTLARELNAALGAMLKR